MNCDMYDKEISEEEYARNGGVCDDCYSEINDIYDEEDDYVQPYKDIIDKP